MPEPTFALLPTMQAPAPQWLTDTTEETPDYIDPEYAAESLAE